jgi:hypothetical protein
MTWPILAVRPARQASGTGTALLQSVLPPGAGRSLYLLRRQPQPGRDPS